MNDSLTEILTDLLLRWEEAKRDGVDLTPQQLCPDRPDLWSEISSILRTNPIVEEMLDTTKESGVSAPAATAAPDIPGFEIVGVLGRGAMSTVYLAQQTQLHRKVALKVLHGFGAFDSQDRLRFHGEIKANARLQHPNVVQIYEAGEYDSAQYLALEYVEGGNLRERLAAGPMPPDAAACLIRDLAEALQAAHSAGIVHRDLKPANILLTPDSSPKIADFGLAKLRRQDGLDASHAHATQSGAILGTPTYMAPEQAAGRISEVGAAADVYALGAILYECMTGRPPFQAASLVDLLDLIRHRDPPPPRLLQPRLPVDLETICLKCLHKDSTRRYATAQDLAEDLRRFQMHVPIHARPVGWLERAAKFTRRNAVLVGGVAATILALTAGLIGVGIAFAEQRRAQRRAEAAERDRRRSDADSLVQLARVQILSGRWHDALTFLDRALASGVNDPMETRCLRCQALMALSRPEAADELAALEYDSALRPDILARILLWRGDLALGRDDDEAERLLRSALATGQLDDVDQAYVRGALAESSDELIRSLEYVVRRQPHRLRANALLGFTYFWLGRIEHVQIVLGRMQALDPDDSSFAVLSALMSAREGRSPDLDRFLDLASHRLPPEQLQVLRLGCLYLEQTVNLEEVIRKNFEEFNQAIGNARWKTLSAKRPPPVPPDDVRPFPMPLYLKKAIMPLLRILPFHDLNFQSLVKLNHTFRSPDLWATLIDALEQLTRVHPEATLLLLQSHTYEELGRWEEAESAIEAALSRPGVLQAKHLSTARAIVIWHRIAVSGHGMRRLWAHAKILGAVRSIHVARLPYWQQAQLVPICVDVREWGQARLLVSNYMRSRPDDVKWFRVFADVLFHGGDPITALVVYERILQIIPESEREPVRHLMAVIRRRIDAQPPRVP